MHKIPLYDLINCVHAFCIGFYLCFKQQYLGLNKFVMVSTSVKLALLSTFNVADANVAKAVFFPYCSFFIFFCLCNIQDCFTSVKLALLSTFNMADANVAKAVFFLIAHSSFSSTSVIFSIALQLVTLASNVQ
jgi:hypothetical protein